MTKKDSNLETKTREDLVLSDEPIKIGVVHYFWDSSSRGVNTVVRNSVVKGLGSLYPNSEVVLIGEHFQKGVFDNLEKRKVPLVSSDSYWLLLGALIDSTNDLDAVIIENPIWGKKPYATQAFKGSSEREGKPFHWRLHDAVWERPEYWPGFKEIFPEFGQAIPRSENFSCSVLTLPAKSKMQNYYDKEINIIRNSVVLDDYLPNPEDAKKLRNLLEENEIVKPGQKIISCPNRIVDRKLIEHGFPIVKNMRELTGEDYILLVTESIDDEFDFPQENVYHRILEDIAKKQNIPVSLGEASKFVDQIKNGVSRLYDISEFGILPSKIEGFGYGNVEPWLCHGSLENGKEKVIPGIGRFGDVHQDFEQYGMNFKHYWNDEVLNLKRNYIENIKYSQKILSDENEYLDFKKRMKLEWRLEQARNVAAENEIAIIKDFNHLKSAKDLAKIMKLPGYQKIG